MITWMQKHKKYLVITIWISTIAFVGAGFVGWGAYDFNNSRATSVAKVGSVDISYNKFNQAYSNLYNYYANISGGKFSQDMAEKMGLDQVALNSLIQEALILNFAKDLGLDVDELEIAEELKNDPNFQTNGNFNRTKYELMLKNIRMSAKEYENSLKTQILFAKIMKALEIKPNENDFELFASSYFMKDKIAGKLITSNLEDINPSKKELEEFWKTRENNYKTQKQYELKTAFVKKQNFKLEDKELEDFYNENKTKYKDKEDKILSFEKVIDKVKNDLQLKKTKRLALESYIDIKKGKAQADKTVIVDKTNKNYPMVKIMNLSQGDILKPVEFDDGFIIIKLSKIIEPRVMNFSEAEKIALEDYRAFKNVEILKNKAEKLLKSNEKLTDLGFISKSSQEPILGLSKDEFGEFLSKFFASSDKRGYVILNDKVLVYDILEQILLDNEEAKQYEELVNNQLAGVKNEEFRIALLKALGKRYQIKRYYKGGTSDN